MSIKLSSLIQSIVTDADTSLVTTLVTNAHQSVQSDVATTVAALETPTIEAATAATSSLVDKAAATVPAPFQGIAGAIATQVVASSTANWFDALFGHLFGAKAEASLEGTANPT